MRCSAIFLIAKSFGMGRRWGGHLHRVDRKRKHLGGKIEEDVSPPKQISELLLSSQIPIQCTGISKKSKDRLRVPALLVTMRDHAT